MPKTAFLKDRRGASAAMFAISSLALLALGGGIVDTGDLFSARRRLQGATDLAAIAAAANLPQAHAAANAVAADNGYLPAEVTAVETGTYAADPKVPPAQRFVPGGTQAPNAVRVTMLRRQPVYFGGILALAGGSNTPQKYAQVGTSAIAATRNVADFSIGSRLVSLDGGIANTVLGGLAGGTPLSLSVMDYNALAAAQVDLFALGQQLAVQSGQIGGTYAQAASRSITLGQFTAALIAAAPPQIAGALQQFALAASFGNSSVNLAQLIDYGPFANFSLSDPAPRVAAGASVLSLLQAAASASGSPHLITLSLSVNIPGLAAATGMLALGEPAVGMGAAIAVNAAGSTVHTAQTRLFLDVTLAGAVSGGLVHMPLYLEIASGTASLASLACSGLDASTTQAVLKVTPGLVSGWIGAVSPSQMSDFNSEPVVAPATLFNLPGVVTVTGQATASIANQAPMQVAFSEADITAGIVKTTNTTDFTASLIASLLTKTSMSVNGVPLPGLPAAIGTALALGAPAVDMLVNDVLRASGIGVGQADTWINGARCGAGVLAG